MSCNGPVSLPGALSGVGGWGCPWGGPHTCSRALRALHIREQAKQWGLELWALILRGKRMGSVGEEAHPPSFPLDCDAAYLLPAMMKAELILLHLLSILSFIPTTTLEGKDAALSTAILQEKEGFTTCSK